MPLELGEKCVRVGSPTALVLTETHSQSSSVCLRFPVLGEKGGEGGVKGLRSPGDVSYKAGG